jgi:hypothetical protein
MEANRPAAKRVRLYPTEKEVNSPPAAPWESERLSSIKGRIGENIVRLEKLRNQRHQKMKRGRSFIYFTRFKRRWSFDGFSSFLFSTFSLKRVFFKLMALMMQ